MQNNKNNGAKRAVLAGSILLSSVLGASALSGSIVEFRSLGSGSEVRSNILKTDNHGLSGFEMTCGADSSKTKDAKCGAKKKAAKKGTQKKGGKAAESKCGQGKCGGK